MGWKQIRAKWEADPEFRRVFQEEYPYAELADAVAELRAQRGLTQEALAQRIGTRQSVISRLESGRHPVNTDLLNRIARSLGMTWRPAFSPIGTTALEARAGLEHIGALWHGVARVAAAGAYSFRITITNEPAQIPAEAAGIDAWRPTPSWPPAGEVPPTPGFFPAPRLPKPREGLQTRTSLPLMS